MAKFRPAVFVLTDGSGNHGKSRLASTTRILEELQATPGGVYGCMTDKQVYLGILENDVELFATIVEDIASALVENNTEVVAGDSIEGYNPTHDLCRVIIDCAVRLAACKTGRPVRNFTFPLTNQRLFEVNPAIEDVLRFPLDQHTFDRKLAAARRYSELNGDVEGALQDTGIESFQTEWLVPAKAITLTAPFKEPPFYEQYGEKQVSLGYYDRVLRYREHFLPLAESLRHRFDR
jgi:hypothetical protein